jgi:hypothetical protein
MLENIIEVVFFILFAFSLFLNFKLGRIVLRVEDEIENSLDTLDERFASISKILQIPLYYDSPEIRQVLLDIEKTRNAILKVAASMGASIDENSVD